MRLDPRTLAVFERLTPGSLTMRDEPDTGLDATHIALAEAVSSLTLRLDATDAALAHAAEDEWRAEWRGRIVGALVGLLIGGLAVAAAVP